jgi:hypothetical protein
MVYEAVPIDVEIQKLTAAESSALSRYKIHENINTLFANEKVPSLIAASVVVISAPTILRLIFEALNRQDGIDFDFKEGAINYLTFTKDFGEAMLDIAGPSIGGPFFEGEAADFWDKYVTK